MINSLFSDFSKSSNLEYSSKELGIFSQAPFLMFDLAKDSYYCDTDPQCET